jgi:hypothetical protein
MEPRPDVSKQLVGLRSVPIASEYLHTRGSDGRATAYFDTGNLEKARILSYPNIERARNFVPPTCHQTIFSCIGPYHDTSTERCSVLVSSFRTAVDSAGNEEACQI